MVRSVCPRERDRPRHAAQVAADQHDRRGRHGHIGAGADRHAHVRLRQGRGVVDPITDHAATMSPGLQLLHLGGFIARQHLGQHLVNPHLAWRSPRRCAGCRR